MYIVPQRIPAPSAAQTPRRECDAGAAVEEATTSKAAPAHITSAPPKTPVQRRQPAWRSSLKKRKPQRMPRRLFEFHKGKAMLKPMSRMAKIVSVLATAQRRPANIGADGRGAENERGQAPAREKNADDHDERNDHRRDADGNELRGRFRGAEPGSRSEAGEDAEHLKLFRTRRISDYGADLGVNGRRHFAPIGKSTNKSQKKQSAHQDGDGHPKMNIPENTGPPAADDWVRFGWFHIPPLRNPGMRRLISFSTLRPSSPLV